MVELGGEDRDAVADAEDASVTPPSFLGGSQPMLHSSSFDQVGRGATVYWPSLKAAWSLALGLTFSCIGHRWSVLTRPSGPFPYLDHHRLPTLPGTRPGSGHPRRRFVFTLICSGVSPRPPPPSQQGVRPLGAPLLRAPIHPDTPIT